MRASSVSHNLSLPPPGLDGGRTFFNAVKEGDTVIFASDDEQDRILWVQAMYRATGQSHKPVPPTQVQKLNSRGSTAPQLDAPISQFCKFVSVTLFFPKWHKRNQMKKTWISRWIEHRFTDVRHHSQRLVLLLCSSYCTDVLTLFVHMS